MRYHWLSLIIIDFHWFIDNQCNKDNQDNHDNHNYHGPHDNHDNDDNHDNHDHHDNQVRLAHVWFDFRVILNGLKSNIWEKSLCQTRPPTSLMEKASKCL